MSQPQRTGAFRALRPAALTAARRNRVIAGAVAACLTAGFATAALVQVSSPAPVAAAAEAPTVADIVAAQPQSYQASVGSVVNHDRDDNITLELEPEPTPEPEPTEAEATEQQAEPVQESEPAQPAQQAPAQPAQQAPAPSYSGGSPKAIAQSMMSASEFTCFDYIISRESGWNVRATNPSSGAYGLAQALPGSKMSTHGSDWATNPATQISWAIDYMKGRYGSICGAYNFWTANHWY